MHKLLSLAMLGVLFLLLSSCDHNLKELDNEVLAGIVADMHIAEIALKRYDYSVRDSMQNIMQEKLEKVHDLPRDEIKKQVESLMDDPARQSEVYTIVIKILQELEKGIKQKSEIDIKKNRKE